jgi:hypothetical protein
MNNAFFKENLNILTVKLREFFLLKQLYIHLYRFYTHNRHSSFYNLNVFKFIYKICDF